MPQCSTRTRLDRQSLFKDILLPHCSISLHQASLSASLTRAAKDYLKDAPRSWIARGQLADIAAQLQASFPEGTLPLQTDILEIATLYGDMSRHQALRVRLEKITTDSCRKFHVDCVDLRLLRAYVGPGVQWTTDNGSTIQEASTGAIVFLKGKHFPQWDHAEKVLHRSPPLSHRPAKERIRLLLTIDEANACGEPPFEMAA
ncbi:DUF1826 domain-containing protein [Gluconobacter oxydans]|uniref:DUF1826 domain-containing protein n=1 Tax=Gluconobacter oxydans TaxID=442 RepID=UPI00062C3789|nr:DUF1826 domain-containing protein [Gluconobacter oxydans]